MFSSHFAHAQLGSFLVTLSKNKKNKKNKENKKNKKNKNENKKTKKEKKKKKEEEKERHTKRKRIRIRKRRRKKKQILRFCHFPDHPYNFSSERHISWVPFRSHSSGEEVIWPEGKTFHPSQEMLGFFRSIWESEVHPPKTKGWNWNLQVFYFNLRQLPDICKKCVWKNDGDSSPTHMPKCPIIWLEFWMWSNTPPATPARRGNNCTTRDKNQKKLPGWN